jgi:hypothetical protein
VSDTTAPQDSGDVPEQSTDTRTRLILDCTFSDDLCKALLGQPATYSSAITGMKAALAGWGADVRMYVPGTHPDENPIAHGQASPAA